PGPTGSRYAQNTVDETGPPDLPPRDRRFPQYARGGLSASRNVDASHWAEPKVPQDLGVVPLSQPGWASDATGWAEEGYMASFRVGVGAEAAAGETGVALVPTDVAGLAAVGAATLVTSGAGTGAWFSDGTYAHTGADVVAAAELAARADVL